MQRTVLTAVVCLTLFGLWRLYENLNMRRLDLFLSVVVISSLAFWLDRKTRTWLDLNGERRLTENRRAVIEIALREPDSEKLISVFGSLLREQWQSDFATLLFNRRETHASISF